MEYFIALRENLLECIVAIISTLSDTKQIKLINNYTLTIIEYAQKINEPVYYPSYVN